MNEYVELLEKPFLKSSELAKLLNNASRSTISKLAKEKNLTKYPWGYSTDEIIEKLNLKKYVRRHKRNAGSDKLN